MQTLLEQIGNRLLARFITEVIVHGMTVRVHAGPNANSPATAELMTVTAVLHAIPLGRTSTLSFRTPAGWTCGYASLQFSEEMVTFRVFHRNEKLNLIMAKLYPELRLNTDLKTRHIYTRGSNSIYITNNPEKFFTDIKQPCKLFKKLKAFLKFN